MLVAVTDATMLSGESANGKYPVESVRTMATIDKNAQTLLKEYGRLDSSTFDRSTKTEVCLLYTSRCV